MSDATVLPLALAAPDSAYPERADVRRDWLDRALIALAAPVVQRVGGRRRSGRFLHAVRDESTVAAGLADGALAGAADTLRVVLRRHGFEAQLVARAFALVREAARRTLAQAHFDVQLLGGRVLLDGMVAEMATGEGKTLTATLPACTAALAGLPVHVVTVNDYLARRDAEWMGPVYRALGLTVGVVTHELDAAARRAAYACDVTYCTNKEAAFDYLRDRIVLGREPSRIQLQLERLYADEPRAGRLVLRGLCYAIVDEADSVLIDEARTPLVISGQRGPTLERRLYETALVLADRLETGRDVVIDARAHTVQLTDAGRGRLEILTRELGGLWSGRRRAEELVRQALTARHLFERDRHYLVANGKVQIIDEYTGRTMADRSWERGLHQLIEVKEGCAVTGEIEPRARISYQRFFRRYLRLAGMTGTAREVAGELWSVYGLRVVSIPPNRPLIRRGEPDRVFPTAEARWHAVVERVERLYRAGRPVLVGTRSVAASEEVSRRLDAVGVPHRVLNARHDDEEAAIVAQAGEHGRVTVATNMAGRGTDIRLADGVAARGGLHVIATERHEARRIDRQLFGRCGRQGDPGTYEALVSLEDELVVRHGHAWRALARRVRAAGRAGPLLARVALVRAQRRAARLHARMRRDLLRLDEQVESMLAFSGRFE